VLTAAVDDELLGRNPLRGVKPPRVEPKPMRFLSHEDVATLACHVDPRYRAFVLVAAYTGLRAGELMALRSKHIDLLHQTITIDEQVQYIGGRHLGLPPKSAAGRRSLSQPSWPVSWRSISGSTPSRGPKASSSLPQKVASSAWRTSAGGCGNRPLRKPVLLRFGFMIMPTSALCRP
jgi:integrase